MDVKILLVDIYIPMKKKDVLIAIPYHITLKIYFYIFHLVKKNRKFGTVSLIVGNRKQLLLTETLLKQNKNTNVRYGVQNAFRGLIYMFVNVFSSLIKYMVQ